MRTFKLVSLAAAIAGTQALSIELDESEADANEVSSSQLDAASQALGLNAGCENEEYCKDQGDTCWLDADVRGIYKAEELCKDGWKTDHLLSCYEPDPTGYDCAGIQCIEDGCPSGYEDSFDVLGAFDLFDISIPLGCRLKSPKYTHPARIKSISWGRIKYRSCGSGYRRSGGWCKPDVRCPDGRQGDGNNCMKKSKTKAMEFMQCPADAEDQDAVPPCFRDCEVGEPRALNAAFCFGTCPVNTKICGGHELGMLCLDESLDCAKYIGDLIKYSAEWAAIISSQNYLAIIQKIFDDHPNLDYGMCGTFPVEFD